MATSTIHLMDKDSVVQEQISSGSGSWIVPANVSLIHILVWGGGGGGSSGTQSAFSLWGGTGGGGSIPLQFALPVTPGQSIPYSIGTAGSGTGVPASNAAGFAGGNGGSTTFSNISVAGGLGGTPNGPSDGIGNPSGVPGAGGFGKYLFRSAGSQSNEATDVSSGVLQISPDGEDTLFAMGGTGGRTTGVHDSGGGGAGGAGFGDGGNGGNGTNGGTPAVATVGVDGGGGGGGGSNGNHLSGTAGAGFAGGSGGIIIWFNKNT